jgi:hypothetical protein
MRLVCSNHNCRSSKLSQSNSEVDWKDCRGWYGNVRKSACESFCVLGAGAATLMPQRTVASGREVIVIVREAAAVRYFVKELGCTFPTKSWSAFTFTFNFTGVLGQTPHSSVRVTPAKLR